MKKLLLITSLLSVGYAFGMEEQNAAVIDRAQVVSARVKIVNAINDNTVPAFLLAGAISGALVGCKSGTVSGVVLEAGKGAVTGAIAGLGVCIATNVVDKVAIPAAQGLVVAVNHNPGKVLFGVSAGTALYYLKK